MPHSVNRRYRHEKKKREENISRTLQRERATCNATPMGNLSAMALGLSTLIASSIVELAK